MDTLQTLLPTKELNSLFWEYGKLNTEVSHQLILIAENFIESCDLKTLGVEGELEVVDLYFTGSLCNYNWSEQSDVDVHIMVDYSNIEDKYRPIVIAYLQAMRNDYNTKYDLKVLGFDVELSPVDSKNPIPKDSGVYSLFYDKWIKNSSLENLDINKEYILSKVSIFKNYIDWVFTEERDPLQTEKITNYILNRIKKLRKSSLDEEGEFGEGNLIFKVLRREGYIDKLRDLQIELTNQELSMEETEEINIQPKKAVVLKDSFYFRKGEIIEGVVSDKGILQLKEHALNEGNYILLEKLSKADTEEVKALVKSFMKLFLWRLWTRNSFLIK